MKKEKIIKSFLMATANNSQELRMLAKKGKIDENQEDLSLILNSMAFKDAVEVVTNHRNMKGSRRDVVSFFENRNVAENVKISAAVYLCNKGGHKNV